MTPKEAAAALDGNEYGDEGSNELFVAMRDAGLVAVFGASDDLMEFRGAIEDEVGACNGGTAYLDSHGLLVNECIKENAATVKAVWAPTGGLSWRIDSQIPHRTFTIMEGQEKFCEGIVFALIDVKEKAND